MRKTGIYKVLGESKYFLPHPLPPSDPPLQMTPQMIALYGEASFALGQLDEMSLRLPDTKRFIKAYVIKEALLSSAIEGIKTTIMEVLSAPLAEMNPDKDTQLVLNYGKALDAALKMVTDDGLPLVSRVILRAHEVLMTGGEGEKSAPGFFRKQSVRVGDLVPPPAPDVPLLMSNLERYINEQSDVPALIKAGLVHVHFETIHPFLDGNGRIGRLIIVLMLISSGLLRLPILYCSYYFKKQRDEYYRRLDAVRTDGDFEGWISYYLVAIRESSKDAYVRAKDIEALELKLYKFISSEPEFAKMRETAKLALDFLFSYPITTISEMSAGLNKAYNTVSNILKQFMEFGLVIEVTSHKRNKLYRFEPYLNTLQKEY